MEIRGSGGGIVIHHCGHSGSRNRDLSHSVWALWIRAFDCSGQSGSRERRTHADGKRRRNAPCAAVNAGTRTCATFHMEMANSKNYATVAENSRTATLCCRGAMFSLSAAPLTRSTRGSRCCRVATPLCCDDVTKLSPWVILVKRNSLSMTAWVRSPQPMLVAEWINIPPLVTPWGDAWTPAPWITKAPISGSDLGRR